MYPTSDLFHHLRNELTPVQTSLELLLRSSALSSDDRALVELALQQVRELAAVLRIDEVAHRRGGEQNAEKVP